MEDENIVSVILRDTAGLHIDESYRFCLVLLQEKRTKRDLIVGCSNVTKLQTIQDDDNLRAKYSKLYQLADSATNKTVSNNSLESKLTDISVFEKISAQSDEITNPMNHEVIEKEPQETNHKLTAYDTDETMALFGRFNPNLLPVLGICILIISLFLIIWGARKLRNERNNNRSSTCYSAGIDQIGEIHEKESRNRYLKLQATTSL